MLLKRKAKTKVNFGSLFYFTKRGEVLIFHEKIPILV